MGSQEKKKVIIIGAGIVGVSAGLWLQRAGHEVILVDRMGVGEGTSYGNGGVLASCAVVPVTGPGLLKKAPFMLFKRDEPLFLKWRYLPSLLPWLVKYLKHNNEADTRRIAAALTPIIGDSLEDHLALAKGTAAERYIVPGDYVYVYRSRSEFEKEELSWDIRAKNGFKWKEIGPKELADFGSGISSEFQFGIALPGHGRITDPGAYAKALGAEIIAGGGKLIKGKVDDFNLEGNQIRSVVIDGSEHRCDAALIATGVWSVPLMKKLGVDIPMESERGYHIELINPSSMPSTPLMISSGKFVITPMDGRIRCAGVLEFGGLELGPSQAPFELLERHFKNAFPGITWERMETWMGHRPAPSDSIPVIGEIETAKGVFAGFGHHHVGLTGGPKTGRILAQMIGGDKVNLDLASYSPMRFI
ncbi:MAG: FAD-binding oxidoreductase [Salaquimonas sp.]